MSMLFTIIVSSPSTYTFLILMLKNVKFLPQAMPYANKESAFSMLWNAILNLCDICSTYKIPYFPFGWVPILVLLLEISVSSLRPHFDPWGCWRGSFLPSLPGAACLVYGRHVEGPTVPFKRKQGFHYL